MSKMTNNNINADNKKHNRGRRLYSCKHCGAEFKADPPDTYHTTARTFKVDRNEVIHINYECKECKKQNGLFWSTPE